MALIAPTIQRGADLGDEGLALLRIRPRSGLMPCQAVSRLGATEPLVRLLPGQLEPVQGPADGLAAAAAAKLRLHEANHTPQRPAWLYLRSGDRWTGRLALGGRTCSPSAAAISGRRGGGHRCAGTSTPRGRVQCRRAATPSRSAPVVP